MPSEVRKHKSKNITNLYSQFKQSVPIVTNQLSGQTRLQCPVTAVLPSRSRVWAMRDRGDRGKVLESHKAAD